MFDNDLLTEIRERFHHADSCPYQGPRAFFENAGGSLTLRSVVDRTAELMTMPDNQGRANPASEALVGMISKGREDMMTAFGARSGLVMVGESGTELCGRLIRTAIFASGGDVVGSSLEHPATYSPSKRWAELAGRGYERVAFDVDTSVVGVTHYEPAITANTSVATIIHASPVTGMHVDVAAIAARVRSVSPDAYIIVDGIQHAAHGHIDVEQYDIDGYVVSGYKFFSRHNYGVAWISDRLAAVPHDQVEGAPSELWELGTRDASAYATFSEVVRYLEWLGVEGGGASADDSSRTKIEAASVVIRAHEHALVTAMLHGTGGLPGLGQLDRVLVVGPTNSEHRSGLVSFEIEGLPAAEVVQALSDDGVRTHVRKCDYFSAGILEPLGIEACVRASVCHYNTLDEVERMLATINRLVS